VQFAGDKLVYMPVILMTSGSRIFTSNIENISALNPTKCTYILFACINMFTGCSFGAFVTLVSCDPS